MHSSETKAEETGVTYRRVDDLCEHPNGIGTEQVTPTEFTGKAVTQLLNYCATYPNPVLRFCASDMVLRVYSDTSYLSVSKGRSRSSSYFISPASCRLIIATLP